MEDGVRRRRLGEAYETLAAMIEILTAKSS